MTKNRKEAVIIVDYQNDFANPETGSLYVNSWETIAKAINKIVLETKQKGWIIISSRELHPAGHISFASNYIWKEPITDAFARWEAPTEKNSISLDEINSGKIQIAKKADFTMEELKEYIENQDTKSDAVWPDHCIDWEFGSEFYKDFDSSKVDIEIKKGFNSNTHPYSAFGGETLDETKTLLEVLQEYNIELVKIVGLATDYCNIATAMDAKENWFEVEFIEKATAWVTPDWIEQAIKTMQENWIKIID